MADGRTFDEPTGWTPHAKSATHHEQGYEEEHEQYADPTMATNTGSGYPRGALSGYTQVKDPKTGLWTKRDTTSGQFTTVKKTGGTFKGIKRER